MPNDPIRASRERAKAFESQESRLRLEAAKRLPEYARSMFGDTASSLSKEQAAQLRDRIAEELRGQLSEPVPDPLRGPELADLNPLNAPSRVLDVGMGMVPDEYRPTDLPELTGTQAIDDVMMGKQPRLDDVGDTVNMGLTTAGAFLPSSRIFRGGKFVAGKAAPLAAKAGKSILGAMGGAGIAGYQQQRLERAQELMDQANALQEKMSTGEAFAQAGEDVTFESQVMRAAGEAIMEGATGSLAFAPNVAKAAFAKLTGVTSDQASRVVALLERHGISPNVADVTDVPWLRRGADVLGKFPITSKITRSASERRGRQVGKAIRSSTESLAPILTELRYLPGGKEADRILNANVAAFNRIEKFYSGFKDEANNLYSAFKTAAEQSGASVNAANTAFKSMILRKEIRDLPKEKGKNVLPSGMLKRIDKELTRLMAMDAGMPLQSFINRGREVENLIKELPVGSRARALLVDMKVAMEADIKENLMAPDEVLRLRDAADSFYREGMEVLSGQAGRRFRRVDKNFGKVRTRELTPDEAAGLGIDNPGTASPNKVITTLLENADDIGLVRNLYELMTRGDRQFGKLHFREVVGVHLSRKMKSARSESPDFVNMDVTDVPRLRKSLGLTEKGGDKYNATREMFKLSGVDIEDFDEVLKLADAFWEGKPPDISTFIARRAVLGGFGSLARSFTPGSGSRKGGEAFSESVVKNIASTAGAMILLRGATKQLVDPNVLKGYRVLLDPKKSNRLHNQAIQRLIALDAGFLVLENAGINPMDQIQHGVSAGVGDRANMQRESDRLSTFRGSIATPLPQGR